MRPQFTHKGSLGAGAAVPVLLETLVARTKPHSAAAREAAVPVVVVAAAEEEAEEAVPSAPVAVWRCH